MTNSPQVLLTTEQIEGWEAEAADLARKIAENQTRLDQLRAKLKAAEMFMPKPQRHRERLIEQPGMQLTIIPPESQESHQEADDNLVGAIEKIANSAPRPVSKRELKSMLSQQGFAAERLANYFYTAVHRLKTKGRISVMADGSVWVAPERLEANSN